MNNWQTKKLGEVADILMGQSPPSETYNINGEGLPFFQGKADFNDIYPTVSKYCSRPVRIAQKDDVLLSVRAPVGPVNLAPSEICIGRGLSAIRGKENSLNQMYLFYYMKLNELALGKKGTGSTFTSINRRDIEKIELPLPPFSIQQQIVERLDAIRKLQELNNKEIEKAEELFLSLVAKWFKQGSDWKVKKLEEVIVSMQNGYASRPVTKENGMAQIRPHNITREGQLSLEGIKYVPFSEKDNYLVRKGDVIFNNTNSAELVGKTAYIDEDVVAVFSNHMTRIRVDETKINPYFLATYLHTLYQSKYFQGLCTAWVNQAAINSTQLRGLQVPLPSIEEQRKIVGYLSGLKVYQRILMSEKGKLVNLFDSLLNKLMKPN